MREFTSAYDDQRFITAHRVCKAQGLRIKSTSIFGVGATRLGNPGSATVIESRRDKYCYLNLI